MGRCRYVIKEPDKPHFLTCTVVEWLPVFSRPEVVAVVLESWKFLRQQKGMRLYGFVIMEDHLHFVAQADHLEKCLESFKSFTAKMIIRLLEEQRAEYLLERLTFSKRAHKVDREHQFWQEGCHPEAVFSEVMMREKLEYMHQNPLKRGYVDRPEHWRYSSARNYAGDAGVIEIDRW